jgi:DNA-binding NarL/FixJ family response regulator
MTITPPAQTPWAKRLQESSERRATAAQMHAEGKTVLDIARTLGVSPQAVYSMLRIAGRQ